MLSHPFPEDGTEEDLPIGEVYCNVGDVLAVIHAHNEAHINLSHFATIVGLENARQIWEHAVADFENDTYISYRAPAFSGRQKCVFMFIFFKEPYQTVDLKDFVTDYLQNLEL
tara:strand:- start:278 stop:616 length:339 start_codon:yes stop_codon:yes gene_type:complete